MKSSLFDEKKRKILEGLNAPDDAYTDASPKGSVDAGIRQLVDRINTVPGFVTTSSCAGRIAVYREGSAAEDDIEAEVTQKTTGGKGGGRWLFVSHDPLDLREMGSGGALLESLSLAVDDSAVTTQFPPAYVRLKFEPMILHILCSSMHNARKVLGAAQAAGFRESGISSVNDEQDMVMVGIRTNGLAFDSIIARATAVEDKVEMLVSADHIRLLLTIGNDRFVTNQARTQRFEDGFLKSTESPSQDWEPADVRKARKRAEGLARRQAMQSSAGSIAKTDDTTDELDIGALSID